MHIEKLSILNFKNIADATLEFSSRVNCFLGRNGMGKSNLLEAIYYLSFMRSFCNLPDSALIRHGEEMLLIQGNYLADAGSEEHITCGIVPGKRKTVKRNGKEYERISQHIGRIPLVVVAPQDSRIVTESGEERRRLIDMVISQSDKSYLSQLIRYNKALEQRNKMLRVGFRDTLLYDSIETQMSESAQYIHKARQEWVRDMSEIFTKYYRRIAASSEQSSIGYKSILNEHASLRDVLDANRSKDEVLGYTSKGIHRDDLEMGIDGYSMRRLGSQGQLKTFTIALRLGIFEFLKQTSAQTPILLLDDIFDKLDSDRVQRIMEVVSEPGVFGQIFITDTNRKHLDEILVQIGGDYRLLEVEHGKFTPIAGNI